MKTFRDYMAEEGVAFTLRRAPKITSPQMGYVLLEEYMSNVRAAAQAQGRPNTHFRPLIRLAALAMRVATEAGIPYGDWKRVLDAEVGYCQTMRDRGPFKSPANFEEAIFWFGNIQIDIFTCIRRAAYIDMTREFVRLAAACEIVAEDLDLVPKETPAS